MALLLRCDVTGGLGSCGGGAKELQKLGFSETPGQNILLPLTLMSGIAVAGEVRCNWLEDVGGGDSVVISHKPPLQLLDAIWPLGKFGQEGVELFLWDEAWKSSVAVPVPQQSLWNPGKEKRKENKTNQKSLKSTLKLTLC